MSDVQERVIKIIKKQLEEVVTDKEIELECELSSLGVNSVIFVKSVVEIENEFEIEFDDNDLNFNNFKVIKDLCDYVGNKIEKN